MLGAHKAGETSPEKHPITVPGDSNTDDTEDHEVACSVAGRGLCTHSGV